MIPVNNPLFIGNEKKYLQECIDTGWISSEGPFIKKFEEQFAKKVGRKFGIAICNGSAALDLAVLAVGIKEGDEVIMPTFTIISCAAAIIRAGAIPVLVDSDPLTWNMDVNQVESKITSRTKAIMVVHIYGLPVDMNPLMQLANKHGLKIIEDAAEQHGQFYNDKPVGSFGEISTFSFYSNKHVTSGEGGMVVTDDEEIAEKCRSLRNLCFIPGRRFVHESLGFNFRMTNLQAAVGLAQLENLDFFNSKKRKMGQVYGKLFSDMESLQKPLEKTAYSQNIYWVYGMVIKNRKYGDAAGVMQKLKERGVDSRPFFWPMHEQPVFIKQGLFRNEKYPVAESIARNGFYVPSGLSLTEDDMNKVSEVVHTVFE